MRAIVACAFGLQALASAATQMPALGADAGAVTVSGISSGGAMAVQAHVAWSATFRGAAVFAGAAYDCAQGNVALAIGRCQEAATAAEIPVADLVATTRARAAQGLIDDTTHLATSQVYLFSGTLDQTVRQPGMDAARDYYLNFMPPANVTYVNTVAAGHGWISPLGQVMCPLQSSPYVNDCGIDPQQVFLSQFHGPLQPRRVGALSGTLQAVDQAEFLDDHDPALHSMDANAWLYVPQACQRGTPCRLRVAFHGCNQSFSKIGDQFMRQANLNEWADTNRIVVLYPQAIATPPTNGLGCWDWWGYDSADYGTQRGPQLLAVKRMVDRLTSPRGATR
jgi:poly(3-hydroxybutyrate) depolymerase